MGIGEQYELETTGNIQSGTRKIKVSECCKKQVKVGGEGIGPGATHWYECTKCGKPTDVEIVETNL